MLCVDSKGEDLSLQAVADPDSGDQAETSAPVLQGTGRFSAPGSEPDARDLTGSPRADRHGWKRKHRRKNDSNHGSHTWPPGQTNLRKNAQHSDIFEIRTYARRRYGPDRNEPPRIAGRRANPHARLTENTFAPAPTSLVKTTLQQ